jgi:DNA polymerase-1
MESDGRVHARFNQTVAATGRLSGSDPNLQNIPIKTDSGRRIRRAFVAKPGSLLVGADYSQVELRIVAHMSGDEALLSAFREGKDVHRATAAEIFAVSEKAVTTEQRGIAKAINFGLIYGKTAFGLAQELNISRTEAQAYIDSYFRRYSAVRDFMNDAMEQARTTGYAQTLFGRRRPIRDMNSKNMAVRNNAERMAMNTPVQGTAADIMKMAMVVVSRGASQHKAQVVLQVHDELVLEVPQGKATAAASALKEDMMGAAKLSVPLEVSEGMATNWMDL